MISNFKGKYFYLSNYYNSPVIYEGIKYKNNEAAFQSMKTLDIKLRKSFSLLEPNEAKYKGRNIKLREDWEEVKDDIMYNIVLEKFKQNPDLKKRLISTGNEELIEGNSWNDTYWGVCLGHGQNKLGEILMKVRNELRCK